MDLRSNFRQFLYPKEFRISSPVWSVDLREQLRAIAKLLQTAPVDADGPNPRLLSDLCTGLWRLRGRMVHPDTGRPMEEMKRAYRHFESVWDALSAEGVKIYDHTGEAFEPGKSLRVSAFEPTPGLGRETIIEMIKPTIYFKDHLIQTGEVIVGTPEEGSNSSRTGQDNLQQGD